MNIPLNRMVAGGARHRIRASDQNVSAEKFADGGNLVFGQVGRNTPQPEILLHLVYATEGNEAHLRGVELRPQTVGENVS